MCCLLVNDAPALNAADIGVAMGSGTAVAQQASDLVIVDDNFCTIVHAIQHGRAIYANIQKFVLFLIGTNSVQLLLIIACIAIGLPIPLTPLSILFINLATDGMCSVALSMEHGEPELMTLPPRRAGEPILSGPRLVMLLGHALSLAVVMVANFLFGLSWFTGHLIASEPENCREFQDLRTWIDIDSDKCKDGIARAKTMVFVTLTFAELLRAYTVRNTLRSVWHGLVDNRALLLGATLSLGLALVFIFVPGANDLFGLTASLPWYGWVMCTGGALLVAVVDELVKSHLYRKIKDRKRWFKLNDNLNEIITEIRAANYKISQLEQSLAESKEENKRRKEISMLM